MKIIITDEMKSKLDDINHNMTFDDIVELFVEYIDNETIKFLDFRKIYQIRESTKTYHNDEDEAIVEPCSYLYSTIYCSVKILNMSNLQDYIDYRDYILQNIHVIDILGHKYCIFNSTLRIDKGTGFNINTLEFKCKRVLWLE